jgi:4-amino-4-deoxy-L-arabinose transferase-like glycosyltransferase
MLARARCGARALPAPLHRLLALPELLALVSATAVLNLWNLSINGWANTYYAAAVKSMSTSWHDFLFASMDKSGLMTVDKPPLALWIQALSVRVFGFHPLSILVPQALMGVAAVALLYDLVRRRFGRSAGFVAGVALATTPIIVAVSRHNNPDELLILCTVAAIWFALRALDTGRTRWLVLCGVCIGLGFETKMGAALLVVPAIVAAYMWVGPGGRLRAVSQLLAGGAALAVVGLAWPLLVTLTPAADRPWISGTSDNSIWSLIFGYNGLGRVAGQAGGPQAFGGGGGGAGSVFGGATGPLRLLQSGLGDQAGWLLGSALVAAVALLAVSRLRRSDTRTGFVIAIGGALLTAAVVFSFASGIFHPYYVSYLAPFIAALIGAGAAQALAPGRAGRVIAPAVIAGGAITELIVLNELGGQLAWAIPVVIAIGGAGAIVLATALSPRTRGIALAVALAALAAAPATWAAETLGHATSGTFPTGGPASASIGGPGGGSGGAGGFGRGRGARFGGPGGAGARAFSGGGGSRGGFSPRGSKNPPRPGGAGAAPGGAGFPGVAGAAPGGAGFPGVTGTAPGGAGFPAAGAANGFGGDSAGLTAAIRYARTHGGGTIGVESQSSAATPILSDDANIAGLGGFSGRESSVTASWIAQEVRAGHLRWIITGDSGFGAPGDTRTGSAAAFAVVEQRCKAVTLTGGVKMYDCLGRAAAILHAAQVSTSATEK